jgi:hypothetical protein
VSLATRGRCSTVWRSAHVENTSAIGFEPWYAGRNFGFVGRGLRSVYLVNHVSPHWANIQESTDARDCGVALERVEENIESSSDVNLL